MSGRFAGKTCLVTAAAAGIGRASALAFAAEGARVIALDRDAEGLAQAFAGAAGITTAAVDLQDGAAVDGLLTGIGAVDVLFNCVGMVHAGTLLDSQETDFVTAFDVNVLTMVRMIRAVLPGMIARGGGAIINMASVVGSEKGAPGRCVYGTTKAAVIGLTKSVAVDYIGQGIRCTAICPGTVDTPSLHQRLAATGDYDAAMAAFVARQPIGRLARANEIADLVLHLAASDYTTGSIHLIDGGWTA